MNETLRAQLYDSDVRLSTQPVAVPALLRTPWRVPLVVLIVEACRHARAKREQIVVLNWALRDSDAHAALEAELSGRHPSRPVWVRYEPAMVRATNIAHGLGFLARQGEWLEMTSAGDDLLEAIRSQDLYSRERRLLEALPRPLPFNLSQRVLGGAAP